MEEKKCILIVEDERAIVEILKFNLMREGYDTLEALDGELGPRAGAHEGPRSNPARRDAAQDERL